MDPRNSMSSRLNPFNPVGVVENLQQSLYVIMNGLGNNGGGQPQDQQTGQEMVQQDQYQGYDQYDRRGDYGEKRDRRNSFSSQERDTRRKRRHRSRSFSSEVR